MTRPKPKDRRSRKYFQKMRKLLVVLELEGGFTVNKGLEDYQGDGFGVSFPGFESKIPLDLLNDDVFLSIIQSYQNEQNGYHVTAWIEGTDVYFDITEIVEERAVAKERAIKRERGAYYDYSHVKTIYV